MKSGRKGRTENGRKPEYPISNTECPNMKEKSKNQCEVKLHNEIK